MENTKYKILLIEDNKVCRNRQALENNVAEVGKLSSEQTIAALN